MSSEWSPSSHSLAIQPTLQTPSEVHEQGGSGAVLDCQDQGTDYLSALVWGTGLLEIYKIIHFQKSMAEKCLIKTCNMPSQKVFCTKHLKKNNIDNYKFSEKISASPSIFYNAAELGKLSNKKTEKSLVYYQNSWGGGLPPTKPLYKKAGN